jgi:hypothetical protein
MHLHLFLTLQVSIVLKGQYHEIMRLFPLLQYLINLLTTKLHKANKNYDIIFFIRGRIWRSRFIPLIIVADSDSVRSDRIRIFAES